MRYDILDEPDFIRLVMRDGIEARDLAECAEELRVLEDGRPTAPDRLVQVEGVPGATVDFSGLLDLAEMRKAHPHRNPTRLAVVASTPVLKGIARMYQMLSEHPMVTTRIFETVEEAEAWLREAPESEEDGEE